VVAVANDVGWARLGVVVPKRAVRLAVGRNRVKRWAREAFRVHQHRLPAQDVVLRVHGKTVAAVDVAAAFTRLIETLA